MKRNLIVIILLVTGSLMICKSSNCKESKQIQYKPFKKAIYSVSVTGLDTKYTINSPQILETEFTDKKNIFRVVNKYVPHRKDVSGDLFISWDKEFSPYGSMEMLKFEEHKEGFFIGSVLSSSPFLLPIFPKNKEIKQGSQWEVISYPIAYKIGPYGPQVLGNKAIIKFYWKDTVNVNGYNCAKIYFSINDKREDKLEKYYFKCSGFVCFAIEEGIIVTQWLEITHDIQIDNKKKELNNTMSLQLVDYER